jgi:N-acetylglutamate synthase-like GNAT family acetyltransferase
VNAPGTHRIRRATTDDVAQLMELWQAAGLPAAVLEKQFTDFQVAEDAQGRVVGAMALQVAAAEGRIHSETFGDFALSDTLRPLLWERLERTARSHGLFRLWTDETAPYWKKDVGFSSVPDPPPEVFGPAGGPWLALRLKEPSADPNLLEAQFNLFRETERAKREKLLQRAEALRVIGTVIAALLFIFAIGVLFWFVRHRK